MKYAIISDIHGNIIALKEALKIIEEEQVEKILCLGDIVGIGTRSDDCVKLLMSYKDKLIAVMGNHEERNLYGVPEYIHDGKHKMTEEDMAQERWTQNSISDESKEFLRTLPKEKVIDLEGIKTVLTHYPLNENMEYGPFYMYPSKEELQDLFKKYCAQINLYGHTHVTRTRRTSEDIWYINPGTLGTTDYRDYGTFGILSIDENKNISYVEKCFKYDLKAALDDFDVRNLPKKDHMRDKFFGFKR